MQLLVTQKSYYVGRIWRPVTVIVVTDNAGSLKAAAAAVNGIKRKQLWRQKGAEHRNDNEMLMTYFEISFSSELLIKQSDHTVGSHNIVDLINQ